MSSDGNIDSNDNDGLLKLEQSKILQVISVLFVLYAMKFYYKYFTRKNPLDGPLPLPFIGNMHNLGINLFKGVTRLTEKYGDVFEIYLMSHRILIVSGQKNAEKVLNSSQKNKFCVRPIIGSLKDYDISNGVAFNNDPSSWKYNRRVLMQALGVPMLAKELVAANQREFDKMMKYWRLNYGEKEEFVINITKWVKTYTTDTSFKISTGIPGYSLDSLNKVSLDDLQNDDGEELFSKYLMKSSLEFTELSFAFIQTFAKIQFIPSFIQNYFPIIKERKKKWVRDTFRIKEIILEIIEARRKEIENEPLDKELRADLLTNLLILNTERDETKALDDLPPIQNKQAIGILFESIIGAIDTSSHVFNLSLNIILSNKEAKDKMLEEINRVFGDDLKRPMTYEDFEKLEYCQAAIDEVLRYQAPIPLLIRQTSEDGAEIGGYSWPAGTTLMLNSDRAHKDPKYWKDADQFKPERFLKSQPNETKKYTYAPFGGGIRICPGRHLAKITVTSLIVNLFRHYDVEYYDKNNPIKTYFAIITMVTDFKVILKPKN